MALDFEKEPDKLLVLLLAADLVFIAVHCFYRLHFLSDPLFSIEKDFGYAEVYQYIKEFWIVLLLLIMAIRRKYLVYFSWSLLFLYFLLDDSLRIHERFGHYLVCHFDLHPMLRLRAQDFGELGTSLLFGFLLFIFIGIAYRFSDRTAKQVSKHLFLLVLLVAFFGVLVDMFHMAVPWGRKIWGLLEDGGEMVIMSIIVWYAFGLKTFSEKPAVIPEKV